MVLKELTALRGVSGNEGAVRNYILEKVKPLCDEVRVDRMGNVIATRKARLPHNGHHVMLAAHDSGLVAANRINIRISAGHRDACIHNFANCIHKL